MEEGRSSFKILTGKPTAKRPSGKPRRWKNNVRMDLKEIGINMRNFVNSAQNRLLESTCDCSIEPSVSIGHGVRCR